MKTLKCRHDFQAGRVSYVPYSYTDGETGQYMYRTAGGVSYVPYSYTDGETGHYT